MSTTRDVHFDALGTIDAVARNVNKALRPERPFVVLDLEGGGVAWKVAEGRLGEYYATILGADYLNYHDGRREFDWELTIFCHMRRGEADIAAEERWDRDAIALMNRLGSSLATDAAVLRESEELFGEYRHDGNERTAG